MSVIQYVQALYRIIIEVVIVDPALGAVYVLKAEVSNRFYIIVLRPTDSPKLGLIFPSNGSIEELVAILLTLPLGCKNSPHLLCTYTDTIPDLANAALCCNQPSCKHKLDDHAEALVISGFLPLQESLEGLSRDPYLSHTNAKHNDYLEVFVEKILVLD